MRPPTAQLLLITTVCWACETNPLDRVEPTVTQVLSAEQELPRRTVVPDTVAVWDEAFGRVMSVAPASGTRLLVIDGFAATIRELDLRSGALRSWGGRGEGPGELSDGAVSLFVNGDTAIVPDAVLGRVTRFSIETRGYRVAPIPDVRGFPAEWQITGGGDLFVAVRQGFDFATLSATGDGSMAYYAMGRDSASEVLSVVGVGSASSAQTTVPVYPDSPTWAILPDGRLVLGLTDAYRLDAIDAVSRTATTVSLACDRAGFGPREHDDIRALVGDFFRDHQLDESIVTASIDRLRLPETPPCLVRTLADSKRGHLWVQRAATGTELREMRRSTARPTGLLARLGSPVWDVFDSQIHPVARVALPRTFELGQVVDGLLYGTVTDSLGQQTAMVLDPDLVR